MIVGQKKMTMGKTSLIKNIKVAKMINLVLFWIVNYGERVLIIQFTSILTLRFQFGFLYMLSVFKLVSYICFLYMLCIQK